MTGDEQLVGHFAGIDVLRGAIDGISAGYSQFNMYPQRIAYPDNPDRQVIGANYLQVLNGKIVYMRTIHDSLPF